jgi:hypothetical protein
MMSVKYGAFFLPDRYRWRLINFIKQYFITSYFILRFFYSKELRMKMQGYTCCFPFMHELNWLVVRKEIHIADGKFISTFTFPLPPEKPDGSIIIQPLQSGIVVFKINGTKSEGHFLCFFAE